MRVFEVSLRAVNGRARIILDGGIQRGGDILKAVAMGADVVALGRLQGWGLAAGGQAGVVRMLEILEDELISAMGLTGLTSMDKVTRKYVCPADPVTDAHEMRSGSRPGMPLRLRDSLWMAARCSKTVLLFLQSK